MAGSRTDADIDGPATVLLRHAETDEQLRACHAVMHELRPQLRTADDLLAAVAAQRPQGYRLLAAWQHGEPVALAGYRQMTNLVHGRFLYVDDLVTRTDQRRHRHGERLLAELGRIGREQSCAQLVLDTALANSLAQRFYFRSGLLARGLHFSMDLQ